ncbi:MAG TPA: hypothetical protein ENJ44_06595 [Oceanospirillales bacterium]|nr:hypothetical protein [Oceanospirillales bacterium]
MNNKTLICVITALIILNTQTFANQNKTHAKKLDTKDLVDKAKRPEIKQDNKIEFDNSTTTFEIPKIDLEKEVVKTPAKESEAKKVSADKPSKKHSSKKIVKKTTKKKLPNKNKIVASTRPLSLTQVKEHDKIVFNNGKRNILRRTKTKIIKYPYNYAIPVDSSSLKANADGSFYVINKARFIADSKALKSKKAKNSSNSEIKAKDSEELDIAVTAENRQNRQYIEEKYNHGKKIEKEIKLKNLRENDEVYVVKGVQFVFRKKKATSGVYKFWLVEKLNPENIAVQRVSKNKYKIIKSYLPDS